MSDNPNKPVRMPSAQESLDKVGETLGARENNYNDPRINFDDIAVVWTQLLITEGIIPRDGKKMDGLSVARLMVGMKLVRDAFKLKLDNWVDTAGYGICGLRIAEFIELTEAAEKVVDQQWKEKYK